MIWNAALVTTGLCDGTSPPPLHCSTLRPLLQRLGQTRVFCAALSSDEIRHVSFIRVYFLSANLAALRLALLWGLGLERARTMEQLRSRSQPESQLPLVGTKLPEVRCAPLSRGATQQLC